MAPSAPPRTRARPAFTPSVVTYDGEQLVTNGSRDEGFTLPGATLTRNVHGSISPVRAGTTASPPATPRSARRHHRGMWTERRVRSLTLEAAITVVRRCRALVLTAGPDGGLVGLGLRRQRPRSRHPARSARTPTRASSPPLTSPWVPTAHCGPDLLGEPTSSVGIRLSGHLGRLPPPEHSQPCSAPASIVPRGINHRSLTVPCGSPTAAATRSVA